MFRSVKVLNDTQEHSYEQIAISCWNTILLTQDFSCSFFLQANWQAVQVEKTVEIPQIEYVATQSNQMCEVLGFWDVILCVFPLRSGWGFWTNTVPLKAGKTGHTLIQRILEKLPQELKY